MFEAQLQQAVVFKRILDAIKDLVTDANWDISSSGINLQAMDSSHVSLVVVAMNADGFAEYRADRNITLGMSLASMGKIMKAAESSDKLSIRAEDNGDAVNFTFEAKDGDRVSKYELKLMDIDAEHLGIPETEYSCVVNLPSSEFAKICSNLSQIGDTLSITVSKEGVKFATSGDLGKGSTTLRQSAASDENSSEYVTIELEDESVSQNFAMRYLSSFTKATPLSPQVTLMMNDDVPLVVEYKMEDLGHIRFYLAPKIDGEEGE